MTTYQIRPETHNTFALYNVATGQFDHGGFTNRAIVRKFFNLHFGWNSSYRLEAEQDHLRSGWSPETARRRVGGTYGS